MLNKMPKKSLKLFLNVLNIKMSVYIYKFIWSLCKIKNVDKDIYWRKLIKITYKELKKKKWLKKAKILSIHLETQKNAKYTFQKCKGSYMTQILC